jgi:hypothetical protein
MAGMPMLMRATMGSPSGERRGRAMAAAPEKDCCRGAHLEMRAGTLKQYMTTLSRATTLHATVVPLNAASRT